MVHYFNGNCELCNTLQNTMYDVGVTFRNEPKCLIGRLNCDAEPQICVQQGIPHYPTLKVYPQHNKDGVIYEPGKNQESYSEKNMTAFMNALCGTQRILRGRLNEKVNFVFSNVTFVWLQAWPFSAWVVDSKTNRRPENGPGVFSFTKVSL